MLLLIGFIMKVISFLSPYRRIPKNLNTFSRFQPLVKLET